MVYRIFVEKKPGLDNEAKALEKDIVELLGIKNLTGIRLFNRYDVENIDEEVFNQTINTVFSEPQVDNVYEELTEVGLYFAVEFLPGQFDQRANSAAECIQIISKGDRPEIKAAKVYKLEGELSESDIRAIKKYVINPVEAREAKMEKPDTLKAIYDLPERVEILDGFRKLNESQLEKFIVDRGLAMDLGDIKFCRAYFDKENRDPSITEIKMIDTYWSDHCRHTTFNTIIDSVKFEDEFLEKAYNRYLDGRKSINRTKPMTLMDIGTIAVKLLKKEGLMDKLDESEEINACTVKIDVNVNGKLEKWLLLFKNETHNHPTEIEPFGGAATCVGGAIRDPLSGRSYVYAAMRLTGAGNPLIPISETLEGKLPQRNIVVSAANGYSSYGNQIGLATGQVDEIYHDGYTAKRMEVGAVIAAAPADNVRREVPAAGDKVILLGGKTGRDGCGGATGSSKSHKLSSLEECGAEVQKGNAPEERKLQRLFRNPEASKLIKRCNDFGAGGVSVAIGELAEGLEIYLDRVPKKYEGLDGTELAISESQERMAVVVEAKDVSRFLELAEKDNLQATEVAEVKEEKRLVMHWNNKKIVDISREFLDSNGAEKHIDVEVAKVEDIKDTFIVDGRADFAVSYKELADNLNVCSKRGLSERFDSTIGRGTVLMPFGGKYQRTPIQAMVNKISVERAETDTCSLMAWGYNPFIAEKSPYHSAYLAVVESVSKLVAQGGEFKDVYLSFQEYFEKLGNNPKKWGKPMAALLGALDAQMGLKIGAIGGKDSMSGTFENLTVPPTLISFAVTTDKVNNIISQEFKIAGNKVYWVKPELSEEGLPKTESLLEIYKLVNHNIVSGNILSAYTATIGGVAEAILKMTMGNAIGFKYEETVKNEDIFSYAYGSFIVETKENLDILGSGKYTVNLLGETTAKSEISRGSDRVLLNEIFEIYENKLEKVFSCNIKTSEEKIEALNFVSKENYSANIKQARPKVLIPVFPGTNCEYDSAKAFREAGAEAEIFVINNLSANHISKSIETFAKSVEKSQMIFIPGGFSGGDEPDGSGKLITAFFRNPEIKEAVMDLLDNRDGLMAGICNGFQALIKLGLVTYGKIVTGDENMPTLTYNKIGRHQSKLVRTRVASNKSPWLKNVQVGQVYTVPISHGEGRFLAKEEVYRELAKNGQIITQYVDMNDEPTYDIQFNPNGSIGAIEGIVSPDGRVLGKMGHSERIGAGLYKNVVGDFDMQLFKSATEYFK